MKQKSRRQRDPGDEFVTPYAREQFALRLRKALVLATDDLAGHFDRFRDLLGELVERADALELARALGREPDAPPAMCLRSVALAHGAGEPVSEFLLIPLGAVTVERPVAGAGFTFTRAHAQAACRWFEHIGRKLAIDYEHQSFERCNPRADGLRPAAGWIGGLEVRDDGLWATDVTWTPRAAELLRTGEYRYFSPVIFWHDEDCTELAALGPVALTNDPAMHGVRPLAASRGVDAGCASEPRAAADVSANDGAPPPENDKLATARAEIAALREELSAQAAEFFIERGLRLGKILEATRADWRDDFLRDAALAEQRLARAPVLIPGGHVLRLDGRGQVPPLKTAARQAGESAIEPEDLAAYERAAAAGRVVRSGGAG